jgi:hypothetical protein
MKIFNFHLDIVPDIRQTERRLFQLFYIDFVEVIVNLLIGGHEKTSVILDVLQESLHDEYFMLGDSDLDATENIWA